MKKIYLLLVLTISFIFSQMDQPYPPTNLVSVPTAGTLPKGYFSFENLFTKNGGVVPKFTVGITDNFTIGMSYGIQNFIGNKEIIKNRDYPEIQIKYRVFEESETSPAMVIGVDTQGKGEYYDNYTLSSEHLEEESTEVELNRYEQKALGVYFVLSRNWEAFGNFGFHIGLNKNINEDTDGDDDLNLFFGFDKELNRTFSIFGEYNFARDDDGLTDVDEIIYRKGNGYLNAGLRWAATSNLMLEINVNDLAKNDKKYDALNRELKIIYFEQF